MSTLFEKISAFVTVTQKERLTLYSLEKQFPLSRLIAVAIDNELQKDEPFKDLFPELPTDEYVEYAYAGEAQKILKFMADREGLGLDQILLLRHEIGIKDKETLLLAFRECLEKGFLVAFKPRQGYYHKTEYPEGYKYYRLKDSGRDARRKVKRRANDYEELQRLKKKFKDE